MLISQILNNENKIILLQGDSGGAIVVASSSSHLGETNKMSLLAVETLFSMQTIGGRGVANWEGDQPNFDRGGSDFWTPMGGEQQTKPENFFDGCRKAAKFWLFFKKKVFFLDTSGGQPVRGTVVNKLFCRGGRGGSTFLDVLGGRGIIPSPCPPMMQTVQKSIIAISQQHKYYATNFPTYRILATKSQQVSTFVNILRHF